MQFAYQFPERCERLVLVNSGGLGREVTFYLRMLTLPGITVSIGALVDALEEVAGAEVARRIQWQPDPRIQKIVAGWPARVDARRARALGFEPDADIAEIIRAHIEDELGGNIA